MSKVRFYQTRKLRFVDGTDSGVTMYTREPTRFEQQMELAACFRGTDRFREEASEIYRTELYRNLMSDNPEDLENAVNCINELFKMQRKEK